MRHPADHLEPLTTSAGRSRTAVNSSCCVSCDSRLLVTPPRIFLVLRARARARVDPFFFDDFFVFFFMLRANFLGDRRFLDLLGIMLVVNYLVILSYYLIF